ncbi:hypothetical protein L0663_10285 [Dyadobacter sp. CY107]|uniref:hypothetical protein n=1 Tax=Dyadobacter fanqingshengii TaxID=2906443 RepID=UPI001F3318CD|nr:hypothetical protein [Dyadobacter fanqingshengii]MCF2503765.1 hypothetical protein [Dyadobacter fanqingshengii]
MTRIDAYVKLVANSRKRTGIVLVNPEKINFLVELEAAGVEIIDLSKGFSGSVMLSDDAFIDLILNNAVGTVTGYTNVELYIGPRYQESHYLKSLMPKLLNSEPRKPIFLIFYSKLLFEKFKSYYVSYQQTSDHLFEEDF